MKKINFYGLLLMLTLTMTFGFASCGGDDDDDNVEANHPSDGGSQGGDGSQGGGSQSYTLSQLSGHWVNEEQWNLCKTRISQLPSGQFFSYTYLEDDILSEGVVGFYIVASGKAYETFFSTTTTKYANNSVAGNSIVKSWIAKEGNTVYFMQISGSKSNHTVYIDEENKTSLEMPYNLSLTIQSTSRLKDSYGNYYVKVSL